MHTGHLWKKIHSSYDKMTIWPIMLLLQLHKALSISSQKSSQNFHRLGYKKQGSPFSAVQGPRNMTEQIAVSSDNQEQIWIYHIWRIYLYGKGGTRGTFAISSYQVLELLDVLLIYSTIYLEEQTARPRVAHARATRGETLAPPPPLSPPLPPLAVVAAAAEARPTTAEGDVAQPATGDGYTARRIGGGEARRRW